MALSVPISKMFMVGPTYAKRLTKLGIEQTEDLLYHFPFRYDDFSHISKVAQLRPGETVTITANVLSIKNDYTKSGKKIQKAKVSDETGTIEVTWFNQPFLTRVIRVGGKYNFSGKADWFGRTLAMISPEYEALKDNPIHTGRLVPVYPETYGVSSKWLRSRIAPLLKQSLVEIDDFLPSEITKQHDLIDLNKALLNIHFPKSETEIKKARERLSFDELFLIHLASLKRKKDWQEKILSHQLTINQEKVLEFLGKLPFDLTEAQNRCVREILADLRKDKPMNRLLEGDVGSGKTVVAAVAIYVTFLNGFQSALMAPTQILASQHFETLKQLLTPFGLKITLIMAGKKPNPKETSSSDILVGTHALISEKTAFGKLGLVIVDEQHRFGVEQRAKLVKKAKQKKSPHTLTMTATPIPRTITLTLYGDLDLSVINQMPPGRLKIKTWIVPPQKRKAAYTWIKKQVKNTNEQAFIICPIIETSETLQSVKAATVEYEKLTKNVFPDLSLGLLHGRTKIREKEKIMENFKEGSIDILVATPVVEVGIDIPNATIMMIEAADRFGLAQLHQLRGRVGRGSKESFCLLFSEKQETKNLQRLKAMEKHYAGMELAELDLKMRGPGEIYGTSQHGFGNLKIASFSDFSLVKKTHLAAEKAINQLNQFPVLQNKLRKLMAKAVKPN